ncbi:MAG: PKD domain-containing protein [Bacteroidetes bacterium]|nr:PKD domain-containing protein [Bacteroidota bacterium]
MPLEITYFTTLIMGCIATIMAQSGIKVHNNIIRGMQSTYSYPIYAYYWADGSKITNNKIYVENGGYGIYSYFLTSTTGNDTNYIANNFISATSNYAYNNVYGMYLYYADYTAIVYNNIHTYYTTSSSYAYYPFSSYNYSTLNYALVYNNNFINSASGYAIQSYNGISAGDNNNLYTASGNLGYWNYSTQATLADWQSTTGFDASSISVYPKYRKVNDLHVSSVLLNGAANTSFTSITTDIDGEARSTTKPDIGADEFYPPVNDAGVSSIDSPIASSCGGTVPVYVTVSNFGTGTLSSFTVNWSVNGTAQTSVSKSGLTMAAGATMSIYLGTYTFTTGSSYKMKSYTSLPNGLSKDSMALNDTTDKTIGTTAMKGTYTIGSSGNYTTFTAAVADLVLNGICSAIIIKVDDGTYTEQVDITAINGTSATNTVTFISKSLDSTKVILEYGSGSYPDYHTLRFNGCSYVYFDKMTIQKSSAYYQYVVQVQGNASYNKVSNSIITSTGGSYNYLIFSSTGNDSFNTFENNLIKNGYYSIYWYGNGTPEVGNKFIHNMVDSFYYIGAYFGYQERLKFDGNTIKNNMYSYGYDLYLYSISDGSRINGNKLIANNCYSALYAYYCRGTNDSVYITNNMISGTLYASYYGLVYMYYCDYVNFYYNSVNNLPNSNNSGYTGYFYTYSTVNSFRVYNNIFTNLNTGGYDIYTYSQITDMDYNNFWYKCPNLGYWNGSSYATLSDWQTGSSMDANSLNVDPVFKSVSDLHVTNVKLNGKGTPIGTVTKDYDNELRSTSKPDMGADEFFPPNSDAGVSAIDSPIASSCGGKYPFYATVTNFGTGTLSSFTINWSVNGTAQTSISKSGLSLAPGNTYTQFMGTYTFTAGSTYKVKAYTSSPNGLSKDSMATNDTTEKIISTNSMKGTYTIGSSGNYTTFADAVADLTSLGICSAVTIRVDDGTYIEQVDITAITGTSNTNTVTFVSKSLDSTKVILEYGTATYPDYHTLRFNGCSHVIFDKMTIQKNSTYYNYGVQVQGNASYNEVNNCIITSVGGGYNYLIYSTTGIDSFNTFYNNNIVNSYFGIYWYSNSTMEKGNAFIHNTIDSFYYYGTYFAYQEGLKFEGNTIKNNLYSYGYSMYLYYISDGTSISGNKIITTNNYAGIYGYYLRGVNDSIYITNNMISGTLYASYYGLVYLYYCDNLNFYYNSLNNLVNNNNNAYTGYFNTYSTVTSFKVYNNIFTNLNSGGYDIYNNNQITDMDYNNFYFNTSNLGYWNGSAYATLSDWQSGSGMDANSINVDPKFKSISDLHTLNINLNGKATPIGTVTKDYDGQTRSTSTPDIGADEFFPAPNDAGVLTIDSPANGFCSGTKNVYATIFNYGINTITSATVNWTVNGTAQTSYSYSGSLASGAGVMVKLGSYAFTSSTTYKVKSYTTSPNGTTDPDHTNDTAYLSTGPGMSGTYTIGGTSPNYATFTDAVIDLTARGVCSATTFSVRDGYYNEQIEFKSIFGTSATNTVTFQSSSKDSSKVILDWGNTGVSGSTDYTLHLSGASFLNFNQITISRTNSGSSNYYAKVVIVDGGSGYNNFTNNVLYGIPITSYGYGAEIIYSGGSHDSFNVFNNNIIRNGSNPIYWMGTGSISTNERGNKFIHNWIDSSLYGSSIYYQDKLDLSENTVRDIASGTAFYIYYTFGKSKINANRIYACNYGMMLYYCSGGKDSIYITNNMIGITTSYGYPFYSYYSNKVNIYYNSFLFAGTYSYYYAAYLYNSSSASAKTLFYNNICQNDAGGYAIYSDYGITKADNNDYYTTGGTLGYWNGTSCAALSNWKTASGQDKNSLSVDASFFATDDLHTIKAALQGKAKTFATVKTDNDNEPRISPSDIGADEYVPANNDVGVDSLMNLSAASCGDSNTVFTIRVKNYGLSSQSNIPVVLVINSSVVSTGTLAGPLAAGTDSLYTFKYKRNTFAGGTYSIIAYTNLSTDAIHSNDSISRSITFSTPASIKASKGVVSCTAGSFKIYAKPTATKDTIYWYNASGGYLATGDTFKTPYINAPVTYYAAAGAKVFRTGVKDYKSAGTASLQSYYGYGTTFDAFNDCILDTVTVYAQGTGNIVVTLYDNSGTAMSTLTTSVVGSTGTPLKAFKIPLGFSVPTGSGYYIDAVGSTVSYMYQSPSGKYPYKAGGLIEITGNNAGSSSKDVYYFYNWVVTNYHGCPSKRMAVVANVAGLKSLFTFSSNCSSKSVAFKDTSLLGGSKLSSRKWDFGDGAKDTSKNPTHTYSGSGPYKVTLTITSAAGCTDTISYNVSFGAVPKASFTFTDACIKTANTFTDNTSFSGAYYRLWRFGDGFVDSSKSTSHTYAKAGAYSVTLVTSTYGGCMDSITKTVNVYNSPVVNFGATVMCLSKPVNFVDSTTINGTSATYSWSLGDGNTDTLQNPVHTYATAGTKVITLTVTSNWGCSVAKVKAISVDADPDATFSTSTVSSNQYQFTPKNIGYASYKWEFGDGATSTSKIPTHTYTTTGTFKVKLTVDNGLGCTDVDSTSGSITGIVAANSFHLAVFPNPFKEATNINYSLAKQSQVSIKVYDMLGREIATLINTNLQAGTYNTTFTPADYALAKAGVYMLRISVGDEVINKEIVLLK